MKSLSIRTKRMLSALTFGTVLGVAIGYFVWGYSNSRGEVVRRYSEDKLVRVARVIDGDTIVLEDGMHVRYIGCDTSEMCRIITDPKPMAIAATRRNRELTEGAWVYLHLAPKSGPSFDAHGRLLAEVFLEKEKVSVGEQLVRAGLARTLSWALEKNQLARYELSEASAREKKIGLWKEHKVEAGARFVGSRDSKLFHAAGCSHAVRIKPENIVRYREESEAIEAGRTACPMCLGESDK